MGAKSKLGSGREIESLSFLTVLKAAAARGMMCLKYSQDPTRAMLSWCLEINKTMRCVV